jgi:hypothetical protein
MRRLIPLMILMAFIVTICPPVFAEEKAAEKSAENLPWDKFTINLGTFLSNTDSNVRLSAKGVGASIDPEKTLGLDTTTTVLRAEGLWRFTDNRRHRADLTWFAMRRDGETTLGRDITIDGVTYPTGSTANTSFDMDIYKVAYSYSFFQDDRMDVGAGLGLYIMPINFTLNVSGALNGYTAESITAPLPVLGLRADFALTPKWFIKSSLDLFYLEYENFNLKVEAEGNDYPEIDLVGEIEYKYFGAMLYATFYF